MQITIIGAGAIGSMLAYRFARAGHDVVLVARGARLEALQRSGGLVRARLRGDRAIDEVQVTAQAFDPTAAPDLLIVTVRRQHADSILDEVQRSNARRIMFAFNAATGMARFRDAVGVDRFSWGFPAAIARLDHDVVVYSIVPAWLGRVQITTIGGFADGHDAAELAGVFARAGIPCAVHPDIESWLETHAAMMAPLIACGLLSQATGALSLRDATLAARAIRHGFALVRRSGSQITPSSMAALRRLPASAIAGVLWAVFRFERVRRSLGGGDARGEVVALLDDLIALGPRTGSPLEALRDTVVVRVGQRTRPARYRRCALGSLTGSQTSGRTVDERESA